MPEKGPEDKAAGRAARVYDYSLTIDSLR